MLYHKSKNMSGWQRVSDHSVSDYAPAGRIVEKKKGQVCCYSYANNEFQFEDPEKDGRCPPEYQREPVDEDECKYKSVYKSPDFSRNTMSTAKPYDEALSEDEFSDDELSGDEWGITKVETVQESRLFDDFNKQIATIGGQKVSLEWETSIIDEIVNNAREEAQEVIDTSPNPLMMKLVQRNIELLAQNILQTVMAMASKNDGCNKLLECMQRVANNSNESADEKLQSIAHCWEHNIMSCIGDEDVSMEIQGYFEEMIGMIDPRALQSSLQRPDDDDNLPVTQQPKLFDDQYLIDDTDGMRPTGRDNEDVSAILELQQTQTDLKKDILELDEEGHRLGARVGGVKKRLGDMQEVMKQTRAANEEEFEALHNTGNARELAQEATNNVLRSELEELKQRLATQERRATQESRGMSKMAFLGIIVFMVALFSILRGATRPLV